MVRDSITFLKNMQLKESEFPAPEVEAAHLRLEEALDAPVIPLKVNRTRWWIPAAAAVFLLVLGYSFFNRSGHTALDSQYGRISRYQLPDGSEVTLNANSEIKLGKDWENKRPREVWLEGEAFFRVQKTATNARFIVHTRAMDIVVTGTQFNVASREDESAVLLTEGSVTIRTPEGRELHMKPGDFVRIGNNDTLTRLPVNEEKVLAWKQSKLLFDNTSINEIAKIITRHYGIKVDLSDKSIGEKRISGVMPNDNLDILVEALEATGEFRITRKASEIIISGP